MGVMDSIRRAVAGLSVGQKVGMGAAAIVVALAGAAFFQWVSAPSYTVLYSDVDQSRLSEIIDALDAQSVSYKLDAGGSQVLVPRDKVYELRATLASSGIQGGGVVPAGYELLDKQSLSVSDFRQRVDYQRALEGELARTLTAMDSVTSATVHLVIPEEALFAENQEPVTASVLIDPASTLSVSQVEAVTFLVSSSVEGLEAGQVTVATTDGTVLHAPGDEGSPGVGNRQLRMTQEYENVIAGDVTAMLASVLGPSRASVVVRADLDFNERSTESETYIPESATPLREQTIDETFSGAGAAPVGSVGVDGQALDVQGDGAYDYSRNEKTTEWGINKTITRSVDAPGTVTGLSVAVVVDDGSLTGLSAPDTTEIESLVAAAVGIDVERGDTVQVSAVAFPAPEETGAVAEAPVDAGGGVMTMLPNIAGAVVLLLISVGLLLMSRGGKKGAVPAAWPAQVQGASEGAAGVPMAAGAPGLPTGQPDIVEMVERQPEEIATLLRGWLADRRETTRV